MIRHGNLERLIGLTGQIGLISTDVFDTLLLHNSRSERARKATGEQIFSELLALRGLRVSPEFLADVRLQAQRLAFRALGQRGSEGEVWLVDIVSRQLHILGLPQSVLDQRLHFEVQVEKTSLVANRRLARVLKAHQRIKAPARSPAGKPHDQPLDRGAGRCFDKKRRRCGGAGREFRSSTFADVAMALGGRRCD